MTVSKTNDRHGLGPVRRRRLSISDHSTVIALARSALVVAGHTAMMRLRGLILGCIQPREEV